MKENRRRTLPLLFEQLKNPAVPCFSIFNYITPQPYLIFEIE